MEDKIIFLDFDGVLFDTLKEVYLVSRNIAFETDFLEDINSEEYKRFSKYKYLVYNIWMFYYFNPLIFENVKEDEIVERYLAKIQKRDYEKEEEFCEKFLKAREYLVKNHPDFWRNLEVPYDFFFKIKELYETKKPNIFIISKKNKKSILERFETYNFKLDENKVAAREILASYSSKNEYMEEYMEAHNFSKAIFVDDNINNIKTVNTKKITPLLALWGNCEPNAKGYNQIEAYNKIINFLKDNI